MGLTDVSGKGYAFGRYFPERGMEDISSETKEVMQFRYLIRNDELRNFLKTFMKGISKLLLNKMDHMSLFL